MTLRRDAGADGVLIVGGDGVLIVGDGVLAVKGAERARLAPLTGFAALGARN